MSENSDSAVEVAVKSASYNIILQVLLRILSSLSNAVILRYITKEALGVINVRLLLLYSTCHMFSREAFRRSCLSKFDTKSLEKKFNLLWMSFPVCVAISIILCQVWFHLLELPDPHVVPNYAFGVYITLFSVIIETAAEPVYVFSQSFHFVKLKVIIEGLSLTTKSVSMVMLLSQYPDDPLYAFCFSQILGSLVYTFSYYVYFSFYLKKQAAEEKVIIPIHSIWIMFPKLSKIFSLGFINVEDLYLTWSFFKQTILKQLLTEGERYLMTLFNILSFAEQGLYDVVNNLGSLAARFIFLPIEESGYLLFTQLLDRDKPAYSQKNISMCLEVLGNLLKLMILLGLTIVSFGYSYSQLLLQLYGGSILSSSIATTLLRWHCAYVLFLAVNGVTECFKFAVMNHDQIDRYNRNLVVLSASFLVTAYCLVKLNGSVGFIMANCLNMGFRIVHSLNFILKYFKMSLTELLQKVIPDLTILIYLICVFCTTSVSEAYFCCSDGIRLWIWHLLFGACCFSLFLLLVCFKEIALLQFIYEQWTKKSLSAKKKL